MLRHHGTCRRCGHLSASLDAPDPLGRCRACRDNWAAHSYLVPDRDADAFANALLGSRPCPPATDSNGMTPPDMSAR